MPPASHSSYSFATSNTRLTTSHHDRTPLMNLHRLHRPDALRRLAATHAQRKAARLFYDVCDGVALVKKPQLALCGLLIGRIHEHTAVQQRAVDVAHLSSAKQCSDTR